MLSGQFTLKRAHVPKKVVNMVKRYYEDPKINFTTQQFTAEGQRINWQGNSYEMHTKHDTFCPKDDYACAIC